MPVPLKYAYRGRSGYILHRDMGTGNSLVALGHTAGVAPWSDAELHFHSLSEEYYLVLEGELRLIVADWLVALRPKELLMIEPHIPHAVVGGAGSIEHFGIRVPARTDRREAGPIPRPLPALVSEEERELQRDWGCRIPLDAPPNQNSWLIGRGSARFQSVHWCLAYLNFATAEAANAGIATRHRPHQHERAWEYYTVLRGAKVLRVEDELITVQAGEILEVAPQVCHALHSRQAPFEGFTFRVPLEADDKVECRDAERP